MSPDEIGAILLELVQARPLNEQQQMMHPNNISGHHMFEGYRQERWEALRRVVMEGLGLADNGRPDRSTPG